MIMVGISKVAIDIEEELVKEENPSSDLDIFVWDVCETFKQMGPLVSYTSWGQRWGAEWKENRVSSDLRVKL